MSNINIDFLKNPIFISVLAGLVVFIYLFVNIDDEKDTKNKYKNNNSCFNKIKKVNIFIPILTSLVVWFAFTCIFAKENANENDDIFGKNITDDIFQKNMTNEIYDKQFNYNRRPEKFTSKYSNDNTNVLNAKNIKLNRVQLPDLFVNFEKNND